MRHTRQKENDPAGRVSFSTNLFYVRLTQGVPSKVGWAET
jgi:hypothetical protein